MAGQPGQGEPVTCACGAAGLIIDRAGRFDPETWFVVEHEGGETHAIERFWNGEAFRFRMREEQQ